MIAFLSCLLATLLLTGVLARLWHKPFIGATLIVIWLVAVLGLGMFFKVGFKLGTLDGLYERVFLGFELLWLVVVVSRLYSLNSAS